MTEILSCQGCTHLGNSLVYGEACYRARAYRATPELLQRTVQPVANVGFAIGLETGGDGLHELRVAGDWCGPTRRNWRRVQ